MPSIPALPSSAPSGPTFELPARAHSAIVAGVLAVHLAGLWLLQHSIDATEPVPLRPVEAVQMVTIAPPTPAPVAAQAPARAPAPTPTPAARPRAQKKVVPRARTAPQSAAPKPALAPTPIPPPKPTPISPPKPVPAPQPLNPAAAPLTAAARQPAAPADPAPAPATAAGGGPTSAHGSAGSASSAVGSDQSAGQATSLPSASASYLNNPKPVYPALSRRMREQGRVLLRVYITADGRADRVEVKRSSGYDRLDAAALAAVQRWRFTPARRGSAAIAMWWDVPINFELIN